MGHGEFCCTVGGKHRWETNGNFAAWLKPCPVTKRLKFGAERVFPRAQAFVRLQSSDAIALPGR